MTLAPAPPADFPAELSSADLLEMYWQMLRSRRLDERAWTLHRQGKIVFHISAMGHEGTQVGAAFALRRGHDYVVPYYRDLALLLALGFTPQAFMFGLFGKQGEPTSGARQMPSHWSDRAMNVVSTSSPVATQIPHAAGLALAMKLRGDDRVALTCIGEGSTSQGEWYEGLNWAAVHQLPFICLVQNNVYAISVPMDQQMRVPNVADRAAAFGLPGVVVDGNDVLAVYRVVKAAADRARRGDGPTLVEAKTYRVVPHSSDDDDRSYRTRAEVEAWKQRDPIVRFRAELEAAGLLSAAEQAALEARAVAEVDAAVQFAQAAPYPAVAHAAEGVYAPPEAD
ncbi:MAG: thiamine pyrophosphate-dependent dehydrogenase E1 component subunit alpha [Anaerolineales bacterium]|nr:thiamine pyrophosphate-dependent dehydrogenase E1 component subunit alpha [Anaerolineales bacterium]